MGSLIAFPRSAQARRPTAWGLATKLVEGEATRGRKAIIQVGGLSTVCLVAEVPVAGDVIHGTVSAVVETVRITRHGLVRVVARSTDTHAADVELSPANTSTNCSPRVAGVLAGMRRRRLLADNLAGRSADLPERA